MKTKITLFFLLLMSIYSVRITAQTLNVTANGSFYLSSGTAFTAQNIVNVDANGLFAVEAGTNWTAANEFVNGKITVYNAGTTTVNVGDINQSTATITTVTGDQIMCDYTKSAPTGSLASTLSNYVLTDTEYWSVTKTAGTSSDVQVSGLTSDPAATYNGANPSSGSLIVVRFNSTSNQWEAYNSSTGFGDFALAQEQSVLHVDDVFASKFNIYPNPVEKGEDIYIKTTALNISNIDAIISDITGKQIAKHNQIEETINTQNFQSGVYLIQFNINKGEKSFTKKIIIK